MSQSIYVASETITLGPFTTPNRPPVTGESLVALTDAQYSALDTLRRSHIGSPLVFNGTTFALTAGETLRLQLLAILNAQSSGVQSFFAAVAAQVKTLLQTGAGDIATAKEIIQTVPLFGDTGLTSVQTQMLAAFPD